MLLLNPRQQNQIQDSKNMTVYLSPNETEPKQEPQGEAGDGGGGMNQTACSLEIKQARLRDSCTILHSP